MIALYVHFLFQGKCYIGDFLTFGEHRQSTLFSSAGYDGADGVVGCATVAGGGVAVGGPSHCFHVYSENRRSFEQEVSCISAAELPKFGHQHTHCAVCSPAPLLQQRRCGARLQHSLLGVWARVQLRGAIWSPIAVFGHQVCEAKVHGQQAPVFPQSVRRVQHAAELPASQQRDV